MASYLQVENISKSYGTKVLFDKISFNINEGDKIALIAPNGTGKTSLLSILAGKDSSDSGGEIKFLKDISTAFLEQNYEFNPENTVFTEVFSKTEQLFNVVREYNEAVLTDDRKRQERAISDMDRVDGWSYDSKIKQILTPLNLIHLDRKMKELSGGEVKRVALASLLLRDADFLILDEPTNHLDIEAIEFLEEYLKKSRCTLFMVTHDRYFLDRICNVIFELDGGRLFVYKGNYEYYLEKREERIANFTAETDKARNLLRRELEWIHATPCARSGKAKYRINAFHDLQERASGRIEEKNIKMEFGSSRLGKKVINCSHVTLHYGNQCMLKDFTYNFARFEKLGIVGTNGVGKSTFLNMLTGAVQPDSGVIDVGETIKFGYYHQAGLSFREDQRVFDIVHDIAETVTMANGDRIPVNTFLNHFLFPPSMQFVKVGSLSGGERRRLYLLTVLMRSPNFLILDEPTNDLDILTMNILEEYLKEFHGCLLIVSHDRYFLDKLADHIFIFEGDGKVKDYIGKCSEWRSYIHDLRSRGNGDGHIASGNKKNYVPSSEELSSPKKKKYSWKEQREMERLEVKMEALNAEKAELEEALSSGSLSSDKITEVSLRYALLKDELDEMEMRYLELL
ncbi:MAG: ABC-F family ATP-binding cassette domain-containing protein [Alistipes sp.]|nr:ABC-F family ATP-binding cassette domain-containing protein [Candidatus Minthomonas equi]